MVARGEATVVDVRGRAEWEAGHLPGVPNIPLGYLAERLAELPTDKPVVVHCQGGARSAIAASVLQARGLHERGEPRRRLRRVAAGRPAGHARGRRTGARGRLTERPCGATARGLRRGPGAPRRAPGRGRRE